MEGKIQSEGDVSIGERGKFEGEINAKRVLVSGKFEGVLDAQRLEIIASGRVSGEIAVLELVIEPGGQFSGTSHIKQENEEPRRLNHIVQTQDAESKHEAKSDDGGARDAAVQGGREQRDNEEELVTPEQRIAAINRSMG